MLLATAFAAAAARMDGWLDGLTDSRSTRTLLLLLLLCYLYTWTMEPVTCCLYSLHDVDLGRTTGAASSFSGLHDALLIDKPRAP